MAQGLKSYRSTKLDIHTYVFAAVDTIVAIAHGFCLVFRSKVLVDKDSVNQATNVA
jgi:hypothetical protein